MAIGNAFRLARHRLTAIRNRLGREQALHTWDWATCGNAPVPLLDLAILSRPSLVICLSAYEHDVRIHCFGGHHTGSLTTFDTKRNGASENEAGSSETLHDRFPDVIASSTQHATSALSSSSSPERPPVLAATKRKPPARGRPEVGYARGCHPT